ncbi:hypothetical protein AX14_007759 [Amanita brunnescens Koide BX004]|nr:hypothetical protein AX14_007759 [Amanita brunnescens Koide BX004]
MAAVHARIDVATSAPLTWEKKPKKEIKEEKSFMEEIKLPKIPKEPRAPKDLILQKEKWAKNDRNAANPRPRPQIRQQMTRKEYDKLLRQQAEREKEHEEERFQEECE